MAVDAVVFAIAEPTEAQMQELHERLGGLASEVYPEYGEIPFAPVDFFDDGWNAFIGVRMGGLGRAWTPGYERGCWPEISTVIEAVRAVFGHVYYCGDNAASAQRFTLDMSAEYWDHWRSPDWNAYHQ